MDAVIGVALTATMAGITLASGDEAVDSVTVSLEEGNSSGAQLAGAVRRIYVQGAKRGCRACSVAVTWTADADDHVAGFSGLPAELDVELLPIPLASAGSALVSETDYADTVVCVLEPDVERGLRGRAVVADTDEPRAAVAVGLDADGAAGWLADVLGRLDHRPQRLVLVGTDEHVHPVAVEVSNHVRVDSEAESLLALAHGAALASVRDAVPAAVDEPGPKRLAGKPVWLTPVSLAAMVLVSALVATMPLGSAGPSPAPAPAHVSVSPAVQAPPSPSPPPPASEPVAVPAPASDAPAVNQKQNQSDTSAGVPEGRTPYVPPVAVEPAVPVPPQVAGVPDNCVVLCGFVL
ncbi:hypothetical protein SBE55_26540 [Mycolicibacterium sp. 141076]|uniref:hypothetical protein n=1 Tax=Mycobacteriaceae TaxID=1762 RepID=UPI00299EE216|nr:hypothetical protein [Mycolicibacterium sp. 141076]MDX1881365.1 hypothetical protein [Mycolicibacterium sp. 141076]